jgi:phosphoglycolate phosphatase
MGKIKLVMLDFDGTIADSFASVISCAGKMCKDAGIPFDKSVIENNMGCTTESCISLISGSSDPEVIERLTAAYNVIYRREGLDMIELFDGVLDTVKSLHQKGVKFAITSNNVVPAISYVVERLGLMPYLDCIVGVECVEHGKPEPDIAFEALRRTGVSPDEAVAVGDSVFDMSMGRGAGCHCCGVSYGCDSVETLTKIGAEWVIDSFSELEKIVLG